MSRWDQNKEFPIHVLRQAASLGIYVGEEDGGSGLGRLEASIVFEALSGGCVSTAAYLSIHNMCTWILHKFGSTEIKQEYLPLMLSMKYLSSYCLTEPDSGSDASALKTVAEESGDHYILNGSKAFISGAGSSSIYIVMARTNSKVHKSKGISCFLLDKNKTKGIEFGALEHKMGWNSQPTRTVTFQDCKVPKKYLLGDIDDGFGIAIRALVGGRINIASCSIGAAQTCLQKSIQYSQERKQFGAALCSLQSTQFRLADMATALFTSRLIVRKAANHLDENIDDHEMSTTFSAMAKKYATDACFHVCNEALQLHGGYGYLSDYGIEQFVRDTRVHQILEGTNEIMQMIIARSLLKHENNEL